jgi:hypothetical protein
MEESEVLKKLSLIQYHQSLIVDMLQKSGEEFSKLVIKQQLSEEDVIEFHSLCENLSNLLQEQKAEGFVYYHPLYSYFADRLPCRLSVKEVIYACISQNLYLPLMDELKKYI